MTAITAAYEDLIQRFVAWAETVDDIRAAVIIGSRARTERPADDWSDLDLIFFTARSERYITSADWLNHLTPYWLTFLERTATGDGQERRVLFDGALDVDFVPVPVEAIPMLPQDHEVQSMVGRGVRVIMDKDGALTEVLRHMPLSTERLSSQPPDETTFLNLVSDFWYHTVWTAKKLRRGEWWTALGCVDSYLKWQCVLPMIEWHARATHGWNYDTWMRGRFLEQWADPRAVEGLRSAFGHYDSDDLWRALFGTMDLFSWLAPETASNLGYPYPSEAVQQAVAWVKTCFEERDSYDER